MQLGTPFGTPAIAAFFFGFGFGFGFASAEAGAGAGAAFAGFACGGAGGAFFLAAGLLAFPCATACDDACTTSTRVATAVMPNVTSLTLIFRNLRRCASFAQASRDNRWGRQTIRTDQFIVSCRQLRAGLYDEIPSNVRAVSISFCTPSQRPRTGMSPNPSHLFRIRSRAC